MEEIEQIEEIENVEEGQDFVSSYGDISRTSTGTQTQGIYGRMLGRNEEDTIIYNFSKVFDSGLNSEFKKTKDSAIEIFKNLPGFKILNPTLSAAAIVFVLKYNLDKSNFKSFKHEIGVLKLNSVDLLRYIRYVISNKS